MNVGKKIVCLLLVGIILLLCGCEKNTDPAETGSTIQSQLSAGRLLPEKMEFQSNGNTDVLQIKWTDTTCEFSFDNVDFLFQYDVQTGALDFLVTNDNETDEMDDLYVFDAEGRVLSVRFQERTMLSFSYNESGVMTVESVYGEEDFTPMQVNADLVNRTAPMPPFTDPDDILCFSEWGDLLGGEYQMIFLYEYDDHGNITKQSHAQLGDACVVYTYGEQPMTAAWQRAALKTLIFYVYGYAYSVLAMDIMCMSLVN